MRYLLSAVILFALLSPAQARRHHHFRHHHSVKAQHLVGQLVAHPPGCPRVQFCGCGASVRIFGHSVRGLWLASEWLRRFPRTVAAAGMAAVAPSRHHVVVLLNFISGNTWLVYDANSGGHATRIWPRSLNGFTFVNPRT